jgi:hypothetical protein
MTYQQSKEKAKEGKIIMLPNYVGYFNWDYGIENLVFHNNTYICVADDLDNIKNRNDFYYII